MPGKRKRRSEVFFWRKRGETEQKNIAPRHLLAEGSEERPRALRVELQVLDRRFVERDCARARGVAPPLVPGPNYGYEELSDEFWAALDRRVAGNETETETAEEAVSNCDGCGWGAPVRCSGVSELPFSVFSLLMAVEQQREIQKLVQRQRGRLDVHQHWEESLRVSEDIMKDIQRALLRCRACM